MTYDIVRILEGLPDLSSMLAADGHETRRLGSGLFMCCPFHEEKTPSCKIDTDTQKFHCFGCGVRGDRIDYYSRSRGLTLNEALPALAEMARVGADPSGTIPRAVRKPAPTPATLCPLTGEGLAEWHQATTRLATSPHAISRIAAWRGFSEDVVRWAAAQGLMGLHPWSGIQREAFLVEMAGDEDGSRIPVSIHVRLGPGTRGNDLKKASWRFVPKGCGSWPFVVGNLLTAQHLFILEGQWDALALIDLMGWDRKWPTGTAVVGLRGSTSTAKLLLHALNPKATAFVFSDADGAGAKWFEEDGFLDRMHTRVRRVHAFWPSTAGSDFNDLWKDRLITRELLLGYLLPKMASRRNKPGPTFLRWCRTQLSGSHATAAALVIGDRARPKGRRPITVWKRHWIKRGIDPGVISSLVDAFSAYRLACRS
jgi:hypothetical protein